jgi:pimeloyl-ACP methyl ester carboxylesterase
MTTTTLEKVQVDGRTIAYRELGSGPAVLLIHGWPTSSFLYRDVMPPIAEANRVVAIDLPGFGGSGKPTDVRYDFDFFDRTLDGFLAELDIEDVAVAGHDLGGPIGLNWALGRPERLTSFALLNTLVYPDFDPSVIEFVTELATPGPREHRTSPEGLAEIMRLGVADETHVTDEMLAGVTDPFPTPESRRALAAAGIQLSPERFAELAKELPSLKAPVRIVYGEQDRILPNVADTMARIAKDIPQAEVTVLPDCGHFLQEDDPQQVGELLARFFAEL